MNKELLQMQQAVFARRPVLQEIAEKYSNINLKDYVQKKWSLPINKPEKLFAGILKSQIAELYGKPAAVEIISQIQKKPLVSTTDHLGIWGHPIFVNSALIFSLYFKKAEFIPVLATESVSLNNTSSWSGSLLLHKKDLSLERHSFFPDKLKTLPVFSTPALGTEDLKNFEIRTKGNFKKFINNFEFDFIKKENFSFQASILSSKIWQQIFPSAPKLAYLPLETIVSKYLVEVLEDLEHPVSQIILTEKGRQLWKKYFGNENTFMFWVIDKKGRRQPLKNLAGNKRELISLIQNRQIYASSPLCFAVLLNAGIACAGGFTQTTWLTEIKEKLINLYTDLKLNPKVIASVPTKNFTESSLAWLKIGDRYVSPSALDLFLTGKDYYPKYLLLACKISFRQSLNMAMPAIYRVVIPALEQRLPKSLEPLIFKQSNPDAILKNSGIDL